MHQSNIFVDDDWNVVSVIDFEFAPVQPQQLVGVPHWLSGKSIDELVGPELDEYQVLYDSFVGILREEEAAIQQGHAFSERLMDDWHSGKMWYNAALKSSNGFPIIFEQSLQPRYFPLRMRYSSQPRVATVTRCPAFNYEPFMTYTNFPACNLKLEILSSISMKQTFLICSRLSFPLLELGVCLNY